MSATGMDRHGLPATLHDVCERAGRALSCLGVLAEVKATPGQTFASLDPGEFERWRVAANDLAEGWVKVRPGGAEVLAGLKTSLAQKS